MTDQNQKKQDKRRNEFNQVAAAVTGAIVGAGVAVAGAVVLSDKKNREKVKKVLTDAKDQAMDYVEGIQKQAENKKDEIENEFSKNQKKVQKATKSVQKSLNHAIKGVKKATHMK